MKTLSKPTALQRRFDRLKRSLTATGLLAQGSILRRTIRRDDPQRPGRLKAYGPYYQWTRKREGRTVIHNLTAAQAKAYGRAIRDNRKLEKTLTDMRAISLKLLELTTEGVRKRNRRKKGQEELS